jgi:hypothetical protein
MILPQYGIAVRVNCANGHPSLVIVVKVNWVIKEAPRKEG